METGGKNLIKFWFFFFSSQQGDFQQISLERTFCEALGLNLVRQQLDTGGIGGFLCNSEGL